MESEMTKSLSAYQLDKGARCFEWRGYSSVCDTGSSVVRSSRHLSFNERITLNPSSQLPRSQPPNFANAKIRGRARESEQTEGV